jgi:SAM-dependent methyltransferase
MPHVPTNWQVWRNPEVAGRFADRRRGGLLGGDAQLAVMLELLRYVDSPQMCVLDLGCGDGVLLQTIMTTYPVKRGIALDGSPAMLEKAEVRFQDLGLFSDLVDLVEADFNDTAWIQRLPVPRFDAVVSGFAIHHSEDERKRALYGDIYSLLSPGGVFINVEHVASVSHLGEQLFESAYATNLARHRQEGGEKVTVEEVLEELRTRPDKAANRLASVEAQLGWLRDIGFHDVDCYWKQYELAVLAGFRR